MDLRHELRQNGAYWIFMTLIWVQAVHLFEHTSQVHQYFLGHEHARGLLGAWFDFVWVHFVFNVGIFLALALVWGMWRHDPKGWQVNDRGAKWFFVLVAFQAYHAMEHIIQGLQAWVKGEEATGFIGRYIPNAIAHFDLNLILMTLLVGTYYALRPRRLAPGAGSAASAA